MTKAELNRDIKKLYKNSTSRNINLDDFEKEYKRLYYADEMAKDLTFLSLKIMMDLNRKYHIIPPNQFYIYIDA